MYESVDTSLFITGTFVEGQFWLMAKHYQRFYNVLQVSFEAVCRLSLEQAQLYELGN